MAKISKLVLEVGFLMTLDELSHPNIPGAQVRLNLLEIGAKWQQAEILKTLIELGVIRESMFGDDWWVIYTENGPIDIKLKTLFGENK